MLAILGEVDDRLAQRAALSPALALAPAIGLGELPVLWFHISFNLEPNVAPSPRMYGRVTLDSRRERWFEVSLHRGTGWTTQGRTSFTHDKLHADELGIGRCAPAGLARWIAASAATLETVLHVGNPHTNLRGKKREQLLSWLRGG